MLAYLELNEPIILAKSRLITCRSSRSNVASWPRG